MLNYKLLSKSEIWKKKVVRDRLFEPVNVVDGYNKMERSNISKLLSIMNSDHFNEEVAAIVDKFEKNDSNPIENMTVSQLFYEAFKWDSPRANENASR